MPAIEIEEYRFSDVGGALCLDFANTISSHIERLNEHLNSYDDLLEWARQRSVLSDREIAELAEQAARRPTEDSDRALRSAIELRGAIYHIFAAVSSGHPAHSESLDTLNVRLTAALSHAIVVEGQEGFTWDWSGGEGELDKMLWPVARSAADLLVSGQVERVRECGGHDCGWLFVDTSKNKSRRWCDMGDCGNRAKAHRHYRRRKAVGGRQ